MTSSLARRPAPRHAEGHRGAEAANAGDVNAANGDDVPYGSCPATGISPTGQPTFMNPVVGADDANDAVDGALLDVNDTLDGFIAPSFSLPRDCGGASPSRLSPLELDRGDTGAGDGGGWRRVGKCSIAINHLRRHSLLFARKTPQAHIARPRIAR